MHTDIYLCVCVCVCMHVCLCICVCVYSRACMRHGHGIFILATQLLCTSQNARKHMPLCMLVYLFMLVYACAFLCVYACMYICT